MGENDEYDAGHVADDGEDDIGTTYEPRPSWGGRGT